jgi:uncharacterized protein (DUF1778 family)
MFRLDAKIICGYTFDMGRKKLPESDRREKPLRIRLNSDERRLIDKAAAGNTSSWAREVLLSAAKKRK